MKKIYSSSYKQAIGLDDAGYSWHQDLEKADKEYSDKAGPGVSRMLHKHPSVDDMVCVATYSASDVGSDYEQVAEAALGLLAEYGLDAQLYNNARTGAIGLFVHKHDYPKYVGALKQERKKQQMSEE
jgi:hypothetical protein